jgi:hypothetical protein
MTKRKEDIAKEIQGLITDKLSTKKLLELKKELSETKHGKMEKSKQVDASLAKRGETPGSE